MNSRVQKKINEIKRLSKGTTGGTVVTAGKRKEGTDGLSAAIHSKKDADTFMTALKAIGKNTE